ncbi:MAG: hypothetical protein L0210_09505 [Rhodospirillales bacterium]|nr:hypothetical protein [Rhodospirillales bacterium]
MTPSGVTMLWRQARISILAGAIGFLSPALTQGHEAEDFIGRCKIIAESTVTQPSWIRQWDIHEPTGSSTAILFLKFRHPGIDGVREVVCAYSRDIGQLEHLIIDGITIPVRDGEADQELLLQLKR